MNKFLCIVLSGLLFVTGLFAQSDTRESMLQSLPNIRPDSLKIPVLLKIQSTYFGNDDDSALNYLKQAEQLIKKTGAVNDAFECYHGFVKVYHARAEFREALHYTLKMKESALRINDPFKEAFAYRTLFNVYHNLRLNDSAVHYAILSIKRTEEIKDTFNIATNYGNLCWLYMDLNQYEKAKQFGIKGVEAGEKYKDTVGLLVSLNNLGLFLLRTAEYRQAITYFNRQFELGKLANRRRSMERALINISTCYLNENDLPGAENAVKNLNAFLASNPTREEKIKCYQHLTNGQLFLLKKQFDAAENEFLKGLEIARTDSITDALFDAYNYLIVLKAAKHDFKESRFYQTAWDELNTLMQEEELNRYEMDLEMKYASREKDEKLKVQQLLIRQKNRQNILLLVVLLALSGLFLLAYRNFRVRRLLDHQHIKQLEQEKILSATEAVLKGEEQERTRLAKDLHDGLGGMLSGIKYTMNAMKENLIMTPENAQAFARSMDMLDSSIKEMRRVAHNLMPEVLVKSGLDTALKDYCNDINQIGALQVAYQSIGLEGDQLDQTTAITIYRIVQELLNNTMKHAKAQNAIVQVSKLDGNLSVTVEDDGVGFNTSILQKVKGIGWENIRHRVDFLQGSVDVQSEEGKGTSVHIEFHG